MRVKRRAVRLDEAAEGILIASAGSSNRRSGLSDVVEPSRLGAAEGRWLGTTLDRARAVLPVDVEMRDRLFDRHHVRVPLGFAATRRLAGVLRVGLPPDHGSASRTESDRGYG
jgi:hypothetical protein